MRYYIEVYAEKIKENISLWMRIWTLKSNTYYTNCVSKAAYIKLCVLFITYPEIKNFSINKHNEYIFYILIY